jgi:hypothetical protein
MTKVNFDRFGLFDQYALRAARLITAVDQHRLKGGKVQYQAIIQDAIVDAMHEALRIEETPEAVIRDREQRALAAMTPEQAYASWQRLRHIRHGYMLRVLETA